MKQDDPRLIGPYRLVGRLGSGGMGQVFLGLSAGGRPVAVKVIRAELAADQEFRVRFGREVAAARRVSGLFTALVVGADVDGPVPWLATAYVAGPSLARAVTDRGPLAVRPALALAAGLAEGLSAIHGAGVVHCDLKPPNVLLSPDGPRVIDFGISRAAEAVSVTGVGWVVGSPGFMSPEQAMGEEVGPPSDIFSLGAVLTFAATGGGPFGRGSRPELAYRLVYRPPELDLVPAELRPLVECCLAKDPGQRPTADEVLVSAAQPAVGWLPDALAAFSAPAAKSGGEPEVTAPSAGEHAALVPDSPQDDAALLMPGLRQPSRPSRSRRWRRPLAAAGATASVLTASIAVSVALISAARHPSPPPLVPSAAAASSTPATHGGRPATLRSSPTPRTRTKPAIIPDIDTVTSPGSPTTRPPAALPSATTTAPRSPSPSPTPTTSPSPAPSPAPSTSPSTPVPAPAPHISGAETYQHGAWVYVNVHYANPGKHARGFDVTGVNARRWMEESYPLSAPNRGIVGAG